MAEPEKLNKDGQDYVKAGAGASTQTADTQPIEVENYYCKKNMLEDVQYRIFGCDHDTRIPGDDWKTDLYYAAGHLRELIDRVAGTRWHHGALTQEGQDGDGSAVFP
ncbi:hypothetical protein KTQ74_20020 [Pseudomonas chlororaphis]|uniref:hypothetical protein n=1 Tax=Pseudomonas chlororaphis TaxID=587753 RepID=UPI001E49D204|nr:hypothetical protein [Pseudomonas chlororaphis]MCB2254206.1 hypothetical protein [Pseudomonas chlororaphis]